MNRLYSPTDNIQIHCSSPAPLLLHTHLHIPAPDNTQTQRSHNLVNNSAHPNLTHILLHNLFHSLQTLLQDFPDLLSLNHPLHLNHTHSPSYPLTPLKIQLIPDFRIVHRLLNNQSLLVLIHSGLIHSPLMILNLSLPLLFCVSILIRTIYLVRVCTATNISLFLVLLSILLLGNVFRTLLSLFKSPLIFL